MKGFRSILAMILAMMTAFLVSCSSPTATKPPTYTPEQIARIEQFASQLTELRDKMSILETDILTGNWVDAGSFIHGPLGELRRKMSYLSRELLPNDQKAAIAATKDLFSRLENIDVASSEGNSKQALNNYRAALRDFDEFLELIPGQSESGANS